MTRYGFDEVRAALRDRLGLKLHRGAAMPDVEHDGRFDVACSRTGFVVSGSFPGRGHSDRRFRSLRDVVRVCKLADAITQEQRA